MMLNSGELEAALSALGELLVEREQPHGLAIIGGGALSITRFIQRSTKDLDIVALFENGVLKIAAPLPDALAEAIRDVAGYLRLAPDWLNNGPTSMMQLGLPEGFLARCERRVYGALTVLFASRLDQIHFKLYAAADDRPAGKHHRDLEALTPTADELEQAAAWARGHDPSQGFAVMVAGVLAAFSTKGT
ncbi:MAG: hypothetical protein JWO36_5434 [Myxococcales bacterium]|nr:hypothetical protein [Myxococcales bacterium]